MLELHCRRHSLVASLTVALAGSHLAAQGSFVNFEAPVAQGLTVAQPTAGGTFVIACSTDDNAIVIIDASTLAVVARVPVGQSPVSVVYDAANSRIYTANYIGDSITAVDFPVSGTQAHVASTVYVADAPTDLVVDAASGDVLAVCSGSRELALVSRTTLTLMAKEVITAPNGTGQTIVMQMPWRILQRPLNAANQQPFVILNQRSGSRRGPVFLTLFDAVGLDFTEYVPGTTPLAVPQLPNPANGPPPITLGTSNMAMALAPDRRLYVVGNDARNDLVGEPVLRAHPTGFVESKLWVVEPPPNQHSFKERDLNVVNGAAVSHSDSASMPTDVVLRTSNGIVQTVYVTSFSTDRIIQLNASTSPVAKWTRKAWPITPRSGYTMAGPRSMAIATVAGAQSLFVLDRLDASVRVRPIAANGDLSAAGSTIALNDPFPQGHRLGQSLLYDARRSGTGKVSCASCHIDARTDSLAWDLDDASSTALVIPTNLIDGITGENPGVTHWPANRGPMITQTLQGLRHHPIEVAGADLKPLLTTEPFYWRGKRANFEAFGPAFQALLAGPVPSNAELTAYREYAFTIMYPPNPEQPIIREFVGDLGLSGQLSGAAGGFGSLRGLKAFHERSLVSGSAPPPTQLPAAAVGAGGLTGGRSCVHCHALPTGTNSRITITRGVPGLEQPIKTAQLRGLRQREQAHVGWSAYGTDPSTYTMNGLAATNSDGLFHDGFAGTVNDLIHGQFSPQPPDAIADDVIAFVRQLDTGVAPIVGVPLSVLPGSLGPATDSNVRLGEAQAEAGNAGMVVTRRIGGTTVNLFYNVVRQLYTDPANPNSTTVVFRGPFSGAAAPPILPATMSAGDLIIFEAVPVGSERRIAATNGVLTVQNNTPPTIFTAANHANPRTGFIAPPLWQPILQLTANVSPGNWAGAGNGPVSAEAATAFHNALAAAGSFGVSNPRHHEAPRRIRIHGSNIQLGAKLDLQLPTAWTGTTPTAWVTATFDLNPVLVAGVAQPEVVFETSATIDPLTIAAIQCGWLAAPGVQTALDTGASGSLNPAGFNQVTLRVRNENNGAPAQTSVSTSLALK